MAQPASLIAKAFLKLSEPEVGDGITNLKLQKLLYYAQGFNLAINEEPLFNEEIRAWTYGPVVPEVYGQYKGGGAQAIAVPDEEVSLGEEEKDLVLNVWKVYGQFSAWRLKEMTHEEPPWRDTPRNGVITHDKLKDFFATLVVDDGEEV